VQATTREYVASEEAMESYAQYFEQFNAEIKKHGEALASLEESFKKSKFAEGSEYMANLDKIFKDYNQAQDDLLLEHNERVAEIQRGNNSRRLEVERQHSETVTSIITAAREEEANRLAEFQRRMQRMKEDHEDTLREAAYRLDALGVVRELMNYGKQRRRAQEDFDAETAQRSAQLQAKLIVEQEHYSKSLAELQNNIREELDAEQKRYQAQLRQAEKHWYDQWRAEEERHLREMLRLNQNYNDERRVLNAQHQVTLTSLRNKETEKQTALLGIQTAGQIRMQNSFRAFWNNMLATMAEARAPVIAPRGGWPIRRAEGGSIPTTQLALVGERGPELVTLPGGSYVSNAQDTKQMLGKTYQFNFGNISGMGYPDEIAAKIKERVIDAIAEEIG
jgi:hypothetical protein